MEIERLRELIIARENPSSLVHAVRTALAAVLSYLIARLFRLPEAYWAPISAMIVMQSTMGAALPISVQRLVETGIGAAVGAATASYFPGSVWAFGIAIFSIGMLCAILRVERIAYRFAGITLVMVMLVTRPTNVWIIASHRFFEVSLGIAIGLLLSALCPERPPGT